MAGQKRGQCVKIDQQQELELFSIFARGWAHIAAKAGLSPLPWEQQEGS